MNKKLVGMLAMMVCGMLVVAGESFGEPVEVQRARVDRIRGIAQNEDSRPLGYYVGEGDDGQSGVGGGAGNRVCHIPVSVFTLPELSTLAENHIIESVTIHYKITEYRHNTNNDFDAHVYLLDTADPSGTGDDFYYHGTSPDPNTDVMFVGQTVLPYEEGKVSAYVLDAPIQGVHELTGDALEWFRNLYTGSEPNQSEVFFRFNKSHPSTPADLTGNSQDRFFIETGSEDLFIEITTAEPPPPLQATGGSSTNVFFDAEADEWIAEHVFTEDGTFIPSRPLEVQYLIVGGGGGGGADMRAGGGGGGGVVTGAVPVSAATDYSISVGAGGGPGTNGFASVAFGVTAGGGGAGGTDNDDGFDGLPLGGSGGGGGRDKDGGSGDATGGSGGSGHDGNFNGAGGGGGGAGGNGTSATSSSPGGDGGIGVEVWGNRYGGGGGGGSRDGNGGTGGSGQDGGGDGGSGITTLDFETDRGKDGEPNTGGGGGGAGGGNIDPGNGRAPSGSGGSGIVIVRYVLTEPSGTIMRLF